MSPYFEWILIGWSSLAFCWWGIALWLVSRERRKQHSQKVAERVCRALNPPPLSIFKPIPSLHGDDPSPQLVGALESFVSQLTADAEMLLGIEETEAATWEPVIEKWRQTYPASQAERDYCSAARAIPQPESFLVSLPGTVRRG